jgi:polysaccharide biosynthesis protein PslA
MFSLDSHHTRLGPEKLAPISSLAPGGDSSISDLYEIVRRRHTRRMIAIAFMLSDLAMIALAYMVANFVSQNTVSWIQSGRMIIVLLPLFALLSVNNNAQNAHDVFDPWTGVTRAVAALALACGALLLVTFFLKIAGGFSRLVFLLGGVFALGFVAAGRVVLSRLFIKRARRGLYAKLCIYDGVPMQRIHESYAVDACALGLTPSAGSAATISRVGMLAKGMDRIVVHCGPESRAGWAMVLKSLDVMSEIVMPELDSYSVLSIESHNGSSTIVLNSGRLLWGQRVIKRVFDLGLVVLALPFIVPVFIVVAVAIKLDSAGPVFFRQERIGFGNRAFLMWKFRSMRVDLQDDYGVNSTERDDPRVTAVGAILRKSSIDELPQIINVLLGDMSFVGPRPHAAMSKAGDSLFWEVDESYWLRHVVKPGITGLAQVSGHRGSTFHEDDLQRRLDADLRYVGNWSLWGDIKILVRTFGSLTHKNAF